LATSASEQRAAFRVLQGPQPAGLRQCQGKAGKQAEVAANTPGCVKGRARDSFITRVGRGNDWGDATAGIGGLDLNRVD
jgi:hypothetical protein